MRKRMEVGIVLLALSIALVPSTASAAAKRIPICVSSTTKDVTGTTLAYAMRERLRASQGYDLVPNCGEALFVVGILTADAGKKDGGTTASITLCIYNAEGYDHLVTNWALYTGRQRVQEMATDIVAAIDESVQALVKAANTIAPAAAPTTGTKRSD